jgi:hypothetical protein
MILVWMAGNAGRFQIIWLSGALFLAFSSVCFAAVWRHGGRWFFSRWALRFHAGVAATLITLVVLFYTEENWRGKRAWSALQREATARGESTDWSSLAAPAVPADQNFAKAPGVAELLSLTNQPNSTWPYRYGFESRTSWAWQQFTDLVWWQKFFRDRAENSVPAERRADTLTFPAAPEPQTPAADVLFALDKYAPSLATFRAASQRPALRLHDDYSKDYPYTLETDLGLESLLSLGHLLCLRASAELQQGQSEAAFQDVLPALRLAHLVQDEPYHYAQWRPLATMQFCLQPVWEGLAAHRWNDQQLAALQKQLEGQDWLTDYRRNVPGDTLAMLSLIDQVLAFAEGRSSEFARLDPGSEGVGFWGWVVRTLYPVGWLYQDKTQTCRFAQRFADPLVAASFRNEARDKLEAEDRSFTDPMFVVLVLPTLRRIYEGHAVESLLMQTFFQQAATACALERFRLAQGQYPATLEALTPVYLAQVPADILAPPPAKLKYLRAPDGGFKLYSVGLDGVDNGGKVNSSFDPHLDIVWQLSKADSDLVWIQPGPR